MPSGGSEHASPQQVKAGSAVHLPLEQPQLVRLALGLAVAPLLGEPGFDRPTIAVQATRETIQFGDLAGGSPRQPGIEPLARPLTSHRDELLRQLVGAGDRWLLA